ncbi:MAG: recombinase family protein [Acidimicrobiia bacterium]|nr:recombinase family protein [Acidimicrobiia bacterium]
MGDLAAFVLAGGRLVRCAIYTRQSVSSDDGLSSCQVQFQACESLVRSQRSVGWILLPERFDDEGYSGATTERPALQRLLALVRARKVELVVIHRLDRLSRSVLGCATLLDEFRKFGIRLVIVSAPELGHHAHDGFLMNILASFAEFEREMIAARIAESRARLKARGQRIAGAVPFGYDADPRSKQLVPSANESAVVKWLFEQAAAGRTPAEIADDANANGWRTKERVARRSAKAFGGNLWTARQVIATLRNPVYLGLFREKHDLRIGHHDPIVTHDLFAAAAAQLKARRTREPGKQYAIDWPLKGRIVCAVCERPMSPHTIRYRNSIYRYYRCRSTGGGRKPCGHQVSAPAIENSIEANVSQQLGQRSPIWDLIEVVMWDYRDSSVRVRLLPPVEAEQAQGR